MARHRTHPPEDRALELESRRAGDGPRIAPGPGDRYDPLEPSPPSKRSTSTAVVIAIALAAALVVVLIFVL